MQKCSLSPLLLGARHVLSRLVGNNSKWVILKILADTQAIQECRKPADVQLVNSESISSLGRIGRQHSKSLGHRFVFEHTLPTLSLKVNESPMLLFEWSSWGDL